MLRSILRFTALLSVLWVTASGTGAAESLRKTPNHPDASRSAAKPGASEPQTRRRLPGIETLLPSRVSPQGAKAPARTSLPSILALPEVQAELALSEAQKGSLQELFEQGKAELRRMRPVMEKAPRAEQEKYLAEFRKGFNGKLLQVLSPEQFQRYQQILFQERGIVAAFGSEEVVKSLGITDQQRAEILEIRRQELQEVLRMAQNPSPQRGAGQVKALRQQHEAKMLSRLTDQQRTDWQKQLGAPFKGLSIH